MEKREIFLDSLLSTRRKNEKFNYRISNRDYCFWRFIQIKDGEIMVYFIIIPRNPNDCNAKWIESLINLLLGRTKYADQDEIETKED